MKSYTVKFELFGKKMQLQDVKANSHFEAEEYVREKIIFHSINENKPYTNYKMETDWDVELEKQFKGYSDIFKSFMNIFNLK